MFKSTKFYKISCKNSHCHQHFCLFSHTAAERKLAAKATQTTATAIQTESKIVLKKRKIVETTATPTIYTNSITSTVPPSKNIETRFSTENPQIPISLHSKIPRDKRQKALTSIYAQFCRIYTNLTQNLAHKHAIDQELSIYDKCSPITYSGLVIGVLSRLKRRELALDEDDVGIDGIYKPQSTPINDPIPNLDRFLLTAEQMLLYNYPLTVSTGTPFSGEQTCQRCLSKFLPQDIQLDPILLTACTFHWGKKRNFGVGAGRVFSCCQGDNLSEGCCLGPHVFKPAMEEVYKSRRFTKLVGEGVELAGIDCEMSYTTQGMECVRVTLVDWNGKLVYDQVVKPDNPILDYNTRFSGVKDVTEGKSLAQVREELDKIIGLNTILVGHGLENDLATMGIVHSRCIDTVELFPHPSGMPYRMGLAVLAREKLKRFIQGGEHDSLEDAKACVDLIKYKISQEL